MKDVNWAIHSQSLKHIYKNLLLIKKRERCAVIAYRPRLIYAMQSYQLPTANIVIDPRTRKGKHLSHEDLQLLQVRYHSRKQG